MSGYFSFPIEGLAGIERLFRFLFKSQGACLSGELSVAIESAAEAIPYPDVVVVICSQADLNTLNPQFHGITLENAKARLSSRSKLVVAAYDQFGAFVSASCIHPEGGGAEVNILKPQWEKIKELGAAYLFADCDVVVPAPPHFRFRKPSGDYSNYFIRAEEALADSEHVDFLAFCLLSRISQAFPGFQGLETLFVDSMAIASVAYAVRAMLQPGQRPNVKSFHSHGGLHQLKRPLPDSSFCIISASSTLGLQVAWIKQMKCAPGAVVTLFTFSDAAGAETAIYAPAKPVGWLSGDDATAHLTDLQILGERFYPQQIPIKVGLFKSSEHRVQNCSELSKAFQNANLISLYTRDNVANKVRPFHVDTDVLLANKEFGIWLETAVRDVPTVPQAIIAQDDASSIKLANMCVELFEKKRQAQALAIVSAEGLDEEAPKFTEDKPVLVVAAVISGGNGLLGISRALRDNAAEKSYLVGLQICESEGQATTLRNSLKARKQGSNQVTVFHSVPIGKSLKEAFDRELDVFQESAALSTQWPERRAHLLGTQRVAASDSFLPTMSNSGLRLRRDFVFWDSGYVEDSVHAPLVALTIAAVFEKARTPQDEKEAALQSFALRQVVLDTLVFGRYNDGIIQAAILRNSRDSELDYSGEANQSAAMLSFLEGLIEYRLRSQGEAVFEFAMALRTKRLQLSPSDLLKLKKSAATALKDSTNPMDTVLLYLFDPSAEPEAAADEAF